MGRLLLLRMGYLGRRRVVVVVVRRVQRRVGGRLFLLFLSLLGWEGQGAGQVWAGMGWVG